MTRAGDIVHLPPQSIIKFKKDETFFRADFLRCRLFTRQTFYKADFYEAC